MQCQFISNKTKTKTNSVAQKTQTATHQMLFLLGQQIFHYWICRRSLWFALFFFHWLILLGFGVAFHTWKCYHFNKSYCNFSFNSVFHHPSLCRMILFTFAKQMTQKFNSNCKNVAKTYISEWNRFFFHSSFFWHSNILGLIFFKLICWLVSNNSYIFHKMDTARITTAGKLINMLISWYSNKFLLTYLPGTRYFPGTRS